MPRASLDVEDGVRRVSLRKKDLILPIRANAPAFTNLRKEGLRIRRQRALHCYDATFLNRGSPAGKDRRALLTGEGRKSGQSLARATEP